MKKFLGISASMIGILLVLFFVSLPTLLDEKLNGFTDYRYQKITYETKRFHDSIFIADLHADSLLGTRDLTKKHFRGHVDFPRMLEGNMGLQIFTVVTQVPMWVVTKNKSHNFDAIFWLALSGRWGMNTLTSNFERAWYQAGKLHAFAKQTKNFFLIKSKKDFQNYLSHKDNGDKVIAGLLGIEGAHALDGELKNISKLHSAGYRMMSITHFFDNAIGGSAHGVQKHGLTEKGKLAVEVMNNLGIVIDISHASAQTITDVLRVSKTPVISSHTGVKGTCDNERNLTDEQMQAIAGRGGLIGIAFFEWAICGEDVAAIVKAIKYAVNVVGPRNVALGSDFDGAVKVPFDVSNLNQLTQGLLASGLTENEVRLIMGQNVKNFLLSYLK